MILRAESPHASGHVFPREPVGTDKQAQGCAGEGLKPEGLSPRLRARLLAVTCSLVSLLGQSSKHRTAQVKPEGLSPRLRARLLAATEPVLNGLK